jgi:hypothetical protein
MLTHMHRHTHHINIPLAHQDPQRRGVSHPSLLGVDAATSADTPARVAAAAEAAA